MNNTYLLIFACIFLALESCKEKDSQSNFLTLDFKEQNENPYDRLTAHYIKLKGDPALGDKPIVQVDYAFDKIFVLAGGPEGHLTAFDLSGNFIQHIGKRGNEPGQFVMATSFTINVEAKIISVVDFVQRKIINYSLDSHNFMSEMVLAGYSTCFEYLDIKQHLINNVDDNPNYMEWEFLLSNSDVNITNTYVKKVSQSLTNLTKTVYKCREKIYAYAQYNPVVYSFTDGQLKPVYNLRFGEFKLPPKEYLKGLLQKKDGLSTLRDSDYVSHFEIFETGNIFNTYYSVSNQHYIGLYSKRSGAIYNFNKKTFEDKMRIGGMNKPVGRINEFVVATLNPDDLRERTNDDYDFDPELETLLGFDIDDDNPILFLYKFKI